MGNWKGGIKKQTYKNRLLHQKHQLHDTSIGNLRGLEHKQNNDYAETILTNHSNMAKDAPVPLLRNPIQGNITYRFAV